MAKEARNKGITTRASALLIDYTFSVLRRPSLHMTIKEGNGPSLRVAQKLHFKQFSELKQVACGESAPTTILLLRRDAPHIFRVPVAGLTGARSHIPSAVLPLHFADACRARTISDPVLLTFT